MLQAGQKVYAAPTGKVDPATGLPVYEGSCGLEFVPGFVDMITAFAVAQAKNVGGTPVFSMARCNQTQALNQWRVVAIPQAKVDPATGLPLYSFLCCPGQVQSGSGSGSGFGPAFHFPQESGPGIGSGSGAGLPPVQTVCCLNPIPQKLFLTVQNVSNCACLVGTYELDWNPATLEWEFQGPNVGTCSNPQGFVPAINLFCNPSGIFTLEFYGSNNHNKVADSCSPFLLTYSNILLNSLFTPCPGPNGTINATITQ